MSLSPVLHPFCVCISRRSSVTIHVLVYVPIMTKVITGRVQCPFGYGVNAYPDFGKNKDDCNGTGVIKGAPGPSEG
jgi:hypothetical protein